MKTSGIYDETDLTLSQLIEAKIDVNILDYRSSLLCDLFQIERPRTYSISSTPNSYQELPESLELTVSRKERELRGVLKWDFGAAPPAPCVVYVCKF